MLAGRYATRPSRDPRRATCHSCHPRRTAETAATPGANARDHHGERSTRSRHRRTHKQTAQVLSREIGRDIARSPPRAHGVVGRNWAHATSQSGAVTRGGRRTRQGQTPTEGRDGRRAAAGPQDEPATSSAKRVTTASSQTPGRQASPALVAGRLRSIHGHRGTCPQRHPPRPLHDLGPTTHHRIATERMTCANHIGANSPKGLPGPPSTTVTA